MADVLNAGGRGIEILISGKIPSAMARTWRFYQGYLKKCGNPAMTLVETAYASAKLKTGIIGVKVSIMPPNVRLPDDLTYKANLEEVPAVSQVLPVEEAKQVEKEIEEKIATKTEEQKKEKKSKKKKAVENEN
jgi:ribosomal protein S3